MKKFLDSNLFYGILAVGMAVFLLLYVDSAENPVVERDFTVSVAVSGLAENHLLDSEPGTAVVRVSGQRSLFNVISARDIKASVDLANAALGTGTFEIQYSLPGGLTLVHIRPEAAELTVDTSGTKTLPVICRTYNTVQEGYANLEPVVDPASVTLSGPQRLLDQIESAEVSLDLAGRNSDFTGELAVSLLDTEGNEFTDSRVTLSAEEAEVHAVITENLSSKDVPVYAALSGEIDEKYTLSGVEVLPSGVKITGSYGVISQIESLTTEPVDLSSMTSTFQGYVYLQVPDGVEVLDGNRVEITIRIEDNLARRTIPGIPIEIRNAPEGKTYGTVPMTVDVTLAAYPEVFANASGDGEYHIEIKAFVDLMNEPADARDYTVLLEYPEGYQVAEITEPTVRLYSN